MASRLRYFGRMQIVIDLWTVVAGAYLGGARLLVSFYGFKSLANYKDDDPEFPWWNAFAVIAPMAFSALSLYLGVVG